MAVCLAVIDKNNAPLFIECRFPTGTNADDAELNLHYTVHSSLDIVEEKLGSNQTSTPRTSDLRELYLGLLMSTEEYKLYGYATNTRVKFILVVELANTTLKDSEIRALFRKVHNGFCDVISSPFYKPNTPFSSRKFSDLVQSILLPR